MRENTEFKSAQSPSMLTRARRKCRDIPEVSFQCIDLNNPPVLDEAFDAIVSINVLYILKNPKETVRYFARVLKPKGRIVLATPAENADLTSQFKAFFKPLRGRG